MSGWSPLGTREEVETRRAAERRRRVGREKMKRGGRPRKWRAAEKSRGLTTESTESRDKMML
jgi:hypothetical protein